MMVVSGAHIAPICLRLLHAQSSASCAEPCSTCQHTHQSPLHLIACLCSPPSFAVPGILSRGGHSSAEQRPAANAAAPPLHRTAGGPSVSKAPPLTTPLPGVVTKHAYEVPSAPPATRITTLPNGVRVATEASPGPTASLGIYINSGSIYESAATAGASCMLEAMAWKATSNRTTFRQDVAALL